MLVGLLAKQGKFQPSYSSSSSLSQIQQFMSNKKFKVSPEKSVRLSTMTNDYPMSLYERPAICNLVPPGQCQFNPTFQSVPLLDRIPCGTGGTSFLLRFGLPDETKHMGLTTCACLLASCELMDREKGEKTEVTRPYTVRFFFEELISYLHRDTD